MELDLDVKHAVAVADLSMLPPSTTPLVGEATVVCTLAGRVTVAMKGVHVLKFVDGRRNVSSLTLRVSRNALGNLMDVDDSLLTQARQDTDEWFARVTNVDEFFRASTATDRTAGLSLVAKMSLDVSRSSRQSSPPFSAREGDDIDLVLQLVGLRFLKQHVDVLWRFVSAAPSRGPPVGVQVASDDEREPETEAEAEPPPPAGPTPEERERMFAELFARIDADRTVTDLRLRELDALADALEDGHDDDGDLRVLQTVSERLDVMAVAASCTPDIACCQ